MKAQWRLSVPLILYGAGEAAKLAGERSTARIYFRRLLKVAERVDKPEYREMAEARVGTQPE